MQFDRIVDAVINVEVTSIESFFKYLKQVNTYFKQPEAGIIKYTAG